MAFKAEEQAALRKAIAGNKKNDLIKILAACDDPEGLLRDCPLVAPELGAKKDRDRIIPIIARYWPGFVRVRDNTNSTALMHAVIAGNAHNMIALHDAGALGSDRQGKGGQTVIDLGLAYANTADQNIPDVYIALRHLGWDINAVDESGALLVRKALMQHPNNKRMLALLNLIKAGVDFFALIGIPQPTNYSINPRDFQVPSEVSNALRPIIPDPEEYASIFSVCQPFSGHHVFPFAVASADPAHKIAAGHFSNAVIKNSFRIHSETYMAPSRSAC